MKELLNEMRNLINQVENHLQALSKEYDVEHLSGPQGFTTMYLFRHQDKEIFIKDIERELDISKSVTSNLIKRMEKNGFISIVLSAVDKRCKQIVLTEFGIEKAHKMDEFFKAKYSRLLKDISIEDMETVRNVFRKIKKNLSEE